MILEIVFEQVSLLSMGGYSVSTSLPIDICRFTSYICIAILLFKQYQLFNVFFSWSIVCAIGEIIFFKSIPYRFPNVLYVFSVSFLLFRRGFFSLGIIRNHPGTWPGTRSVPGFVCPWKDDLCKLKQSLPPVSLGQWVPGRRRPADRRSRSRMPGKSPKAVPSSAGSVRSPTD